MEVILMFSATNTMNDAMCLCSHCLCCNCIGYTFVLLHEPTIVVHSGTEKLLAHLIFQIAVY